MYRIGDLIKHGRKSKGLTQEALSEGICSVSNLSRIESNEQIPSRQKLQLLLERTGIDGEYLLPFSSNQEVELLNLEREIDYEIFKSGDLENAKQLLKQLEEPFDERTIDEVYLSFLVIYISEKEGQNLEEVNKRYEAVINKFIPNFTPEKIPVKPRSRKELIMLNGYALNFLSLRQGEQSAEISKNVVACIEKWVMDKSLLSDTYITAIYHWANALFGLDKWEDCLSVLNQGLAEYLKFRLTNINSLVGMLYLKGTCLGEMNQLDESRKILKQAYYLIEATKTELTGITNYNGKLHVVNLLGEILYYASQKGIEPWE